MNPKFMDADGLLNGRPVSEGEIIGKVATWGNFENGTSYHLHFNIQVFTKVGWVWVNPYMTLVAAYERLIGGRGTEIKAGEPAPPVPVKLPVILHPTPPAAAAAQPRHRRRRRPSASSTPPAKAEEAAAERAKPHAAPRVFASRRRHKAAALMPGPPSATIAASRLNVADRSGRLLRMPACRESCRCRRSPDAAMPLTRARLPFASRLRASAQSRFRRTIARRPSPAFAALGCGVSAPARSAAAFRKRPMTA